MTCAQVREIDRRAIAALGGDGYVLMHRAGVAAYRRLRANWPLARRIDVVCGAGNNGGDGYVVAGLAARDGLKARVLAVASPSTPDARRARHEAEGLGAICSDDFEFDALDADLVVDAIFGIGLTRPPEGRAARAIAAINGFDGPVLSLDLPSGLDADRGHAPGEAVRATATVCFIAYKRGLFTGEAHALRGDCWLETLEVDPRIAADLAPFVTRLDDADIARALPPRSPTAHKGHFGHALMIGGELGFGGAIRLSAEAALRAGAGLVSVLTRPAHVAPLLAACPEAMTRGIDDPGAAQDLFARATVIGIGPGLGTGAWSHALLDAAIATGKPLVLDADALNLIARESRLLPPNSVLTPHPGEAARLADADVATLQADRYAQAAALAKRYRATVVLKGAGSVIADIDGALRVCDIAHPGMATGGMGDVLTGVIAALIAQGLSAFDAASVGVQAHARAAQRAANAQGVRGLLARDVIAALPVVLNPARMRA